MGILPLQFFCRVHVLYLVDPRKKGRDTLESFYHHRNAAYLQYVREDKEHYPIFLVLL